MTSDRKARANRSNSQRSTGPKTAAGLARAAQNARRHGLAIPIFADPTFSAEIETLARHIAPLGSPILADFARAIAAAHVDLMRARRARTALLACASGYDSQYLEDKIPVAGAELVMRLGKRASARDGSA